MAITNYNRRCTSCGGNKWEYLKDLKVWQCRYCGAQVERQEQYDGLHTIKNVVRQVILDTAYRRMTQADRGLSECQMINARYPGTLVAGICFRLIAAVSPESFPGADPRQLLGQVRRDYGLLTEETRDLSDDETAVYEFLDSSDAWAVLAMVFDTLGDQQRRDYLLTLTEPSQVFSKETNRSLLRFSLKNSRLDLAQQILSSPDNVDVRDAVQVVLDTAPDGEEKARMASSLIEAGALDSPEAAEAYLSGGDSLPTRAAVCLACCRAGLELQLDVILRQVLCNADPELMKLLLDGIFSRKLYDSELEQLMGFAAAQKTGEQVLIVLRAIRDSGQYVALTAGQAMQFLANTGLELETRREILTALREFHMDERSWEAAAGGYLCQVRENPALRSALLHSLCDGLTAIRAKDFETYVLQVSIDGEEKPGIIGMLLALPDMKSGFFRELTGAYLRTGREPGPLKTRILHQLLDSGLTIDGNALLDFICTSPEAPGAKVELCQLAIRRGTVIRSDALSIYLENCAGQFQPQLFALLYTDTARISPRALENYVLRCPDSPAVKARNAAALAAQSGLPLGGSGCRIRFLGCDLDCSLAQAYLLTTRDDLTSAAAMVDAMASSGVRLNADVRVNGANKRFARFLSESRDQLSEVTGQLCEDRRLFSRFF